MKLTHPMRRIGRLLSQAVGAFRWDSSRSLVHYCQRLEPRLLLSGNQPITRTITSTPALMEYMAKDVAYSNWDVGEQVEGYTVAKVFDDRASSGFYGIALTCDSANPLLVSRGTSSFADALSDLNPLGVGYNQFLAVKDAVETWLAGEAGQRVDMVGHSLGGALTQDFAADWTHQANEIGSVYTFNSPGISQTMADAFISSHALDVMHYVVDGDLVSMVGEAYIAGQYTMAHFSDLNLIDKHTMPILADRVTTHNHADLKNFSLSAPASSSQLSAANFSYDDADFHTVVTGLIGITTLIGPSGAPQFLGQLYHRGSAEEARQSLTGDLQATIKGSLSDQFSQLNSLIGKVSLDFGGGQVSFTPTVDLGSSSLTISDFDFKLDAGLELKGNVKITLGSSSAALTLELTGSQLLIGPDAENPLVDIGGDLTIAYTPGNSTGALDLTLSKGHAQFKFGSSGSDDNLSALSASILGIAGTIHMTPGSSGVVLEDIALSATSAELAVSDVFKLSAQQIALTYSPTGNATGPIFTAGKVAVSVSTWIQGEITSANGIPALAVFSDGFRLGKGTVTTQESITGALTIKNPRLEINLFGYRRSTGFSGSLALAADEVDISIGDGMFQAVGTGIAITTLTSASGSSLVGFQTTLDTLKFSIGEFLTLQASHIYINPFATGSATLVSLSSLTASVKLGDSLQLTGSASSESGSFQVAANGTFLMPADFTVTLSTSSDLESGMEWPSYLPLNIKKISLSWSDFQNHPDDYVMDISAEIKGSLGTLTLDGAVEDLRISPTILARDIQLGKTEMPILSLGGVAVSVKGTIFGGATVDASLALGMVLMDDSYALLADDAAANLVAHRTVFVGVRGGCEMAGKGFTIEVGFCQAGLLEAYFAANADIILDPMSGLTLAGLSGGVTFGASPLPTITNPKDLESPIFSSPLTITAEQWLAQLKRETANLAGGKTGLLFSLASGVFKPTTQVGVSLDNSTLQTAFVAQSCSLVGMTITAASTGSSPTAWIARNSDSPASSEFLLEKNAAGGVDVSRILTDLSATTAGWTGTKLSSAPNTALRQAFTTIGITLPSATTIQWTSGESQGKLSYTDPAHAGNQIIFTLSKVGDRLVIFGRPGSLSDLSSVVQIRAGASISDEYAADAITGTVNVLIETDGKFVIEGSVTLGSATDASTSLTFDARIYADLSTTLSNGHVNVVFLADLPQQTRLVSFGGNLTFDFLHNGVPLTSLSQSINGLRLNLTNAFLEVTANGELTVSLYNASVLAQVTTLQGSSAFKLSFSGDLGISGGLLDLPDSLSHSDAVASAAGEIDVVFPANIASNASDINAWGAMHVTAALGKIKPLADAGFTGNTAMFLSFNLGSSQKTLTLTPPGAPAESFILAAQSFTLLLAGGLEFHDVSMTGVFAVDVNEATKSGNIHYLTFNMFVLANLSVADDEVSFDGMGLVHFELVGSHFAAATRMELSGQLSLGSMSSDASFQFFANSFGRAIDYTPPSETFIKQLLNPQGLPPSSVMTTLLARLSSRENSAGLLVIPGGVPTLNTDGDILSVAASSPYLVIQGAGDLTLSSQVKLQAEMRLAIDSSSVDLLIEGSGTIGPFASVGMLGTLHIDSRGFVGALSVNGSLSMSQVKFDGAAYVLFNTTSTTTVSSVLALDPTTGDVLDSPIWVLNHAKTTEVFVGGSATIGGSSSSVTLSGTFDMTIMSDRLKVQAAAKIDNLFGLNLLVAGEMNIYWGSDAGLTMAIKTQLALDVSVFSGNFTATLLINTRHQSFTTSLNTSAVASQFVGLKLVGNLSLLGGNLTLHGDATLTYSAGVFKAQANMTGTFLGFANLSATGWFDSKGQFDFAFNFDVDLSTSFSILNADISVGAGLNADADVGYTVASGFHFRFAVSTYAYAHVHIDWLWPFSDDDFSLTITGPSGFISYDSGEFEAGVDIGVTIPIINEWVGIHPRLTLGHYTSPTPPTPVVIPTVSNTTVKLASLGTSLAYGQTLTLKATVAGVENKGTPTGLVTFYDGTDAIGVGSVGSDGVASLLIAQPELGTHAYSAHYLGEDRFRTSTSSVDHLYVTSATTLTLTPSATTAEWLQPEILTAKITSVDGEIPTGLVSFYDNQVLLGTAPIGSHGTALLTLANPTLGVHRYTASYGGVGYYLASSTGISTVTVKPAITQTILSASDTTLTYGQSLTLTANVDVSKYGGGTPGGLVTFYDGSSILGTATLSSSGVATFTTTKLAAGAHVMGAIYGGSTYYLPDASSPLGLIVAKALTTTTLTTSPSSSLAFGGSLTLTAHLDATGTSLNPIGRVSFMDGTTVLGTGVLSSGTASLTLTTLSLGAHALWLRYEGDPNFATSLSTIKVFTIVNATPVIDWTYTPGSITLGQDVTYTASIHAATGSQSGIPSGQVSIYDSISGSPTLLGEATIGSNGTISFPCDTLALGTHKLSVVFDASAPFNAVTSADLTVSISPIATVVTLTPPVSIWNGAQDHLLVRVTDPRGSSYIATGTVSFREEGILLGVATLDEDGCARLDSFTSPAGIATPLGLHHFQVSYASDGNFASASSSQISILVTASPPILVTATTLQAAVNPSVTLRVQFVPTTGTYASINASIVSIYEGAVLVKTGTMDSTGHVTIVISNPTPGDHDYVTKLTYSGVAYESDPTGVTIAAPTTLTLQVPSSGTLAGSAVSLRANLASAYISASSKPTGLVTFYDKGVAIGQATIVSTSSSAYAILSLPRMSQGTHLITAKYSGDSGFLTKTASSASLSVSASSVTTSVTPQAASLIFGSSLTLTGQVAVPTGVILPTGFLDFYDDTQYVGRGTLDGLGQTTLALDNLAPGVHSFTARFVSTSDYLNSTNAASQVTIDPISTSMELSVSLGQCVFGQSVTISAQVQADSATLAPHSGLVSFYVEGTLLGSAPVDLSGYASLTVSNLSVGTRTLTAGFHGDVIFADSVAAGASVLVTAADTTLDISSDNTQYVSGEALILSAQVSVVSPGGGSPAGIVTFIDSIAGVLGSAAVDSAGQAALSLPGLKVGSHRIQATYSGTTEFLTTLSSILTIEISPADAAMTLAGDLSAPVFGQPVSFSITLTAVSPGSGIPSGSAVLEDNGQQIASGTVGADGTFVWSISTLSVGSHSLVAYYLGDSEFNLTNATLDVTVAKAATTLSSTSDLSESVYGQALTLTAQIAVLAPGAGIPTGTVSFMESGNVLGTATLGSDGRAVLVLSGLHPGVHDLTASFGGDGNFTASSVSDMSIIVNQAASLLTLNSDISSGIYGQAVTFSAELSAVAPGGGIPTGRVMFYEGDAIVGIIAVDSDGTAQLELSTLSVGTHTITAHYEGDQNFTSSNLPAVNVTVSRAPTTLILSTNLPGVIYREEAILSAQLTVTAPGRGIPTGQVVFKDGQTILGQAEIQSSGLATLSISTLELGSHTLTAEYLGDTNLCSSIAAEISLSILPRTPAVTLTTGTFNYDGSGKSASATVLDGLLAVSGTLVITYDGRSTPPVNHGIYQVTATFTSSDPHYNNASATQTLEITAAPTQFQNVIAPMTLDGESRVFVSGRVTSAAAAAPRGFIVIHVASINLTVGLDPSGDFGVYVRTDPLMIGTYPLTVSYGGDGGNYAAASNAVLTLTTCAQPPVVTLQPVSVSVNAGIQAAFSASASCLGAMTVQWQVSQDNGVHFSNVSGATGCNWQFTAAANQTGGLYRAAFISTGGTSYSAYARLTVQPAPVVSLQPSSVVSAKGQVVSFTARVDSPTPCRIQWQVSFNGGQSFVDITNARSATYYAIASLSLNGAVYRAVFTSLTGVSVATSVATLTVTA